MKLENRTQLELLREKCKESVAKEPCRVLVCGGTGCLAGGSQKIYERFGSKHGINRNQIKISEITEIAPEDVVDPIVKEIL